MNVPARKETTESFVPDMSSQRSLRDALGCFATGITIVTAASTDGPAAITVNSFSSVSLTPPLVLWSIDRHSARFETFTKVKHYAIHILTVEQKSLCMEVAKNPAYLKDRKLATNQHHVPILDDCLVRFDCSHEAAHDAGDHVIIVGRVNQVTQRLDEPYTPDPLTFYRGQTGAICADCR